MAYLCHISNNNFCLEKSAVCHMAIQNYSSNYMNRCSIITIIIIKVIIKYFLLRFKAAIKPPWFWKKPFTKEGRLKMPRTICHQSYLIDLNHQTYPVASVVCLRGPWVRWHLVVWSHDIRVNKWWISLKCTSALIVYNWWGNTSPYIPCTKLLFLMKCSTQLRQSIGLLPHWNLWNVGV